MVITHVLFILRILTDLCKTRQNLGMKNTFSDIVCNVLLNRKN